ncbi:MAG TPA: 2,3,4,5-tetrahydropyridine-2,6-dicarboxylate N-acetyltransferase [Erysipelotrichaceae bacterium]|nr:2,3,4,5-tetrahydropyridine-2,6-dicarboxylate N-acetyltransferase [Erysipelotrichaceae bacterium]
METFLQDPYAIAAYIKQAVKKTPAKLYANGHFHQVDFSNCQVFGTETSKIIFADITEIDRLLNNYPLAFQDTVLEVDRRNSAIELLDISHINARIEPNVTIRNHAVIGNQAVLMMGAVINIGAVIGDETMIDMNAVVGARGTIGRRCHIGAGAVVAGVLEPPSKQPVIIEDDVLIGANAVILEGVRVGTGAVVAAGAIVTEDVPPLAVVAGSPARIVKYKDERTISKTEILDDLRK